MGDSLSYLDNLLVKVMPRYEKWRKLVIAREGKSVNIIGNQQKNATIVTCFIPHILRVM